MDITLFDFANTCIEDFKSHGKYRTADSYSSTIRKFTLFSQEKDFSFDAIDTTLIQEFYKYLIDEGLKPNSIAYYLRSLRAIYNRAVKMKIITNRHPFEDLNTNEETVVRNIISINTLERIKQADFSKKPQLAFARDMFIFSFYARGISFYDMALLKKSNIHNGTIYYQKRGTGTSLTIKIELPLQEIIDRYTPMTTDTTYLLPIFVGTARGSKQYTSAMRVQNKRLQKISTILQITPALTSAVAKHTWVSIALQKGFSYQVIGKCLGLQSDLLAHNYIKMIEQSMMNKVNESIIL